MALPTDPLPGKVLDALLRGNSIEAIKLLRASTGFGLKEAKDAIDQHLRRRPASAAIVAAPNPPPAAPAAASPQGSRIEAIRRLREKTGLGLAQAQDAVDSSRREGLLVSSRHAPGEVPRSGRGAWLVAVLAAAAILGYLLFGRSA